MLQSLRLHIYDNTHNKTYTQLQKNNFLKIPANIDSQKKLTAIFIPPNSDKKIPKANPDSNTALEHNLNILPAC